jgi:hypothetical protein
MKRILTLVTLAGLCAAATANAQVDIYLTGSTAFRANVYRSMNLIYGRQGGSVTSFLADTNGAASGVNHVTWIGTMPHLFGANTVTVHGSYSGSVGGIQALANQTPVTGYYMAGDTTTLSSGGSGSHIADLAFSDVFQASTAFSTPTLEEGLGLYGTNQFVCVQPFAYVKSTTGAGSVVNITQWQVRQMLNAGANPLSLFTGNAADTGLVYLCGRTSDSGTRLTAELDNVFNGVEQMYQPDGTCVWAPFGGNSSGSGITTALNSCGPAIGYLGLSDARNVNSGANILTYNGVLPFVGTFGQALPNVPDYSPITMGQYSYWSYEHLYEKAGLSTDGSDNISLFRNALIAELINDIATTTPKNALNISEMKVKRNTDGAPIHN